MKHLWKEKTQSLLDLLHKEELSTWYSFVFSATESCGDPLIEPTIKVCNKNLEDIKKLTIINKTYLAKVI